MNPTFEVLSEKTFEAPIGRLNLHDEIPYLKFYDEVLLLELTTGQKILLAQANDVLGECGCCTKLSRLIQLEDFENCDEEERAEGRAWVKRYKHLRLVKEEACAK